MMRSPRQGIVFIAALALAGGLVGSAAAGISVIALDEVEIFFEINDTDGDAGIQIFLDGEGWDRMKVFDPDGDRILRVRATDSIGEQGITELFFESAEPSFEEQSLDELLALFPEGKYRFRGTTTEGDVLKGKARLTHALPDGPVLVSPDEDEEDVDPADTVLEWELVADPPGSRIVSYHIVVETDDDEIPLEVFEVDLGPTVTTVTVPAAFMKEDTEYKFEVLAIEKSGNQTISERAFETGD